MAGVKVTMIRAASVNPYLPVERLFEDADAWAFGYDSNLSTLYITKRNEAAEDGSFTRRTLAEFPSSGVESVEFA